MPPLPKKRSKFADPISPVKKTDDVKANVFDGLLNDFEKKYGSGSLFVASDTRSLDVDVISTGSITADLASGVGGVARGRIVEVFGAESSGKTTFCLTIAAQFQREGYCVAIIDTEHALDPKWAKRIGVDLSRLVITQPDTAEQALDMIESFVKSGVVQLVILDSVAALAPHAEIDGDFGDSHMGLVARLMSQAMRKLIGLIKQTNASVIFVNQTRDKIGQMSYGDPTTTTGGKALKFYSTMRIKVARIQSIKVGDVAVGSRTRITFVKNKVAAPFREAEFDIMFDEGLSAVGELLDIGVEVGILTKRGAYLSYGDEWSMQGREKARAYLMENQDKAYQLHCAICAHYKAPQPRSRQYGGYGNKSELTFSDEDVVRLPDSDILSPSDIEDESDFATE